MNSSSRRLTALFVMALVLFLSPAVGALDHLGPIFGLPPAPVLLFLAWTAVIAAAWLVIARDPG